MDSFSGDRNVDSSMASIRPVDPVNGRTGQVAFLNAR